MTTYDDPTSYDAWVKPSTHYASVLPPPGSFGLSRIGGLLGRLVAAAQAFTGDGSRWTHAFIVLDDIAVLQAEPGGARIRPLEERLKDPEVVFCDAPLHEWLARRDPWLTEKYGNAGAEKMMRAYIVDQARRLEGTKYGYLQYFALGLATLGWRPKWLRDFIARRGHLICSQLVDAVYRRCGIQVFNDGRLPQDVTPGDLATRYGIA